MPSVESMLAVLVLLLPAASAQQPKAVEIIQQSIDLDQRNWERARDYTFVQQVEQRILDHDGSVKSVQSETLDVLILDGTPYERAIAKNGKPLSDKDARKASEAFDRERRKRVEETQTRRRNRLAEEQKRREKNRAFAQEIPRAYDFQLVGEEVFEGQRVWVIDATPRPGFQSKVPRADLLPKFRGRLWIDQKEYQWVKVEAETVAPVSFGWVFARLDQGAKLSFRQGRVNSEVWLPTRITMRLSARLALVKKISTEIEVTFREYRKFQTDSRILPAEE
jgi:hypothetical protein